MGISQKYMGVLIRSWPFILFYLFWPIGNLFASEAIVEFSSTVLVQPDASIVVTEQIKADCLGQHIRHGIYREIPKKYHLPNGLWRDSRLKILQTRIDGHTCQYHLKSRGPNIRIYLGRKDYLLPHGLHSFEITYKMERMVGFLDHYDELYWNVTGDNWAFPIEKARCRIILPWNSRFLQYASYTGRHGSTDNRAKVVDIGPRSIVFETTAPLMPGQGFTVAASWPKGMIRQPSRLDDFFLMIRDNLGFIVGISGVMATLIYYLMAWHKVGKDPGKGQIIPRFEPPKAFGPAAARFILKMGFDNKAFSAAVLSLAVKGYLTIEDNKGQFTLIKKEGKKKDRLSEGEKSLLRRLFDLSSEIRLTQDDSSRVRSAIDTLKRSLSSHFERIYFRTNLQYLIPGILLSVLTIGAAAIGANDPFTALFLGVWLTIWTMGTGFLQLMMFYAIKAAIGSRSLVTFAQAFRALLFGLAFTGGWFLGCFLYSTEVGFQALFIFLSLLVINLLFYQLMKAPTMQGRRIMDEIEGFKMFLETAEKKRLDMLTSTDNLFELFEKYLPWAVALGVENKWADKFTQYLTAVSRSSGQKAYSPTWYIGTYYSPNLLSSAIGNGLSSAVTAASVPKGSGSGGGGFSGGGGGGGGGGGW